MTGTVALYVDDDVTYVDGQYVTETPMDALTGLDVFLARISARFSAKMDGGTVLLSEPTLKRLGFPAKIPRGRSSVTHPVLDSARNVGWGISKIGPWMTFYRKGFNCPSVHIAALPWLDEEKFCFLNEPDRDGILMTHYMRTFSYLIGSAYRIRPGVTAGVSLMRSWGGEVPFWSPSWGDVPPAQYARELRYRWDNPVSQPIEGYEHGWDIRQQYLAAASVSEVALKQLIHTGRKTFDRTPGYWLITVPAWNEKRCPHPAGNYRGGELVWVTTPTVSYLNELADSYGVIEPPTIHDSWTAHKSHRLFRTWSEKIRDGIAHAAETGNSCVVDALKNSYKQAFGLWQRESSFIHRPDWSDTIAANARINLHRKVWRQGIAGGGSWPSRIVYDCVYYPGPDTIPDVPVTFTIPGTKELPTNVGKFKFEKTVPAGADLMAGNGTEGAE